MCLKVSLVRVYLRCALVSMHLPLEINSKRVRARVADLIIG
jgi:hypothetical protein